MFSLTIKAVYFQEFYTLLLTTGAILEKSLKLNKISKYAIYQPYHQNLNESKVYRFF